MNLYVYIFHNKFYYREWYKSYLFQKKVVHLTLFINYCCAIKFNKFIILHIVFFLLSSNL